MSTRDLEMEETALKTAVNEDRLEVVDPFMGDGVSLGEK